MIFLKKYLSSKSSTVEIILMLVFAFGLMFFATASSPRYGINPWVDANAFFTVGKSMANGVTIYKDLFEQKGPLLYVIHALAYKISGTSFAGVYVFEAAAMFVSMLFAYKTARLFVSKPLSLGAAVLFAAAVVNTNCFYLGDSAEEFSLPFLMILIYYAVFYFKDSENNTLKWYVFLLNGFFAGCVIMIKFTVLGFWFGWMAAVSIHTLFVRKKVGEAFRNAFIFLCGMAIPVAAFSAYFFLKGGLKEFFETYFFFNINFYSDEKKTIFDTLKNCVLSFANAFFRTRGAFIVSILGCLLALFVKPISEKNIVSKLAVPFIFGCGAFFTYVGGKVFTYYFLTFTAFFVFVFISAAILFEKLCKKDAAAISVAVLSVAAAAVITGSINIAVLNAPKTKEETVQHKISSLINSRGDNSTVLCYSSLDAGIYLFDNIVPQYRYFEEQNIDYSIFPENVDEQNSYIDTHKAQYVVCREFNKHRAGEDTADDFLKILYDGNETLKTDYELILKENSNTPDDVHRGKQTELYYFVFELKK